MAFDALWYVKRLHRQIFVIVFMYYFSQENILHTMKLFSFHKTGSKLSYSGGKTDILKFVLSLFIVAIHFAEISVLSPVLRCAVPLFFMLSSFFFFKKYDSVISVEEKNSLLLNYIKRNLTLYLFWFIVLLPYTIILRGWFDNALIPDLLKICRSFIFSSTFPASWYIMASIIGTSFIALADRTFSRRIIFVIALLAYVFCCISSNYGNIISSSDKWGSLYLDYTNIFTSPYNSFPVSLLWIYIGRYLSKNDETKLSTSFLWLVMFVSLTLLYVEYFYIQKHAFSSADDCYFFLVPLCIVIMLLFGKVRYIPANPFLRKTSTIVFCSHIALGSIVIFTSKLLGIEMGGYLFLIIAAGSVILSWVILRLDTQIKILRYAY